MEARLTSDSQGTDCVLVDCEAHFQGTGSHVFVEYITAREIQYATEILIFGNQPRVKDQREYS